MFNDKLYMLGNTLKHNSLRENPFLKGFFPCKTSPSALNKTSENKSNLSLHAASNEFQFRNMLCWRLVTIPVL